MIEIVERMPCPVPACHEGRIIWQNCVGEQCVSGDGGYCLTCNGDGTVPRVLATFADAATLIEQASGAETMDLGRVGPVVARAVLAALGVTDDQR